MKNFTTLVSTLLLTLTLFCVNATAQSQTYGMYDVPIALGNTTIGAYKLERDVVIHQRVRFIAPNHAAIDIQPDANNPNSRVVIPQGQSSTFTYSSAGSKDVRFFIGFS